MNPFQKNRIKFILLGVFTVFLSLSSWYFLLPPKIIVPENLQSAGQVEMVFSTAMDKQSVEANVITQPKVEGSFQWQSAKKVIFTPTPEYQDQPFTISIGTDAHDTIGRNLHESIALYFTPEKTEEGSLSFVVPEDQSKEVGLFQPITLMWDAAVFPLSNPEKTQQLLHKSITVEPALPAGSWQILGTNGILFEPLEPLTGSTQYHITIPESITGEQIDLTFETERIKMLGLQTEEIHDLTNQDALHISFSQPINPANATTFITLEDTKTNTNIPFIATEGSFKEYSVTEEKEVRTPSDKVLKITPKTPWPKDTNIEITINEGFVGRDGQLGIEKTIQQNIKTLSPLKFTHRGFPLSPYDALYLNTNNPVNAQQFIENTIIKGPDVTPDVIEEYKQRLIEGLWQDESMHFVFPPLTQKEWVPGQKYSFDFSQNIADIFNQPLEQKNPLTFTTRYEEEVSPLFFPLYQNAKVYDPESDITFAFFYTGQFTDIEITLQDKETNELLGKTNITPIKSSTKKSLLEIPLKELFGSKILTEDRLKSGYYQISVDFDTITEQKNKKTSQEQRNQNLYNTSFFISDFVVEAKIDAQENITLNPNQYPNKPESKPKGPFTITPYINNWNTGKIEKQKTYNDFMAGSMLKKEPEQSYDFIKITDQNKKVGFISPTMNQTINHYDAQNITYSPWFYQNPIRGSIFTERPLYKPGQKIYLKALLRQIQGTNKTFPLTNINEGDLTSATITIKDPFWKEIASIELTDIKQSLDATWTLPEDTPLGEYQVFLDPKIKTQKETSLQFSTRFYVTEYRKPKFLINASFDKETILDQEEITLSTSSQYVFGGSLSEKTINYTLSLYGEECFGDWFWFCEKKDRLITRGQSTTDKDGNFTLTTNINLEEILEENDKNIDWNLLTANISVSASADEYLSKTISIPFSKANGTIKNLRSDQFFTTPEAETNITGTLQDLTDTPLESKTITLQTIHNKWVRTDKKDSGGTFRGDWQMLEEIKDTTTTQTTQDGSFDVVITLPKESGEYTIRALYQDEKNRTTQSEISLWVWGGNTPPQIRTNDANHILKLLPEKQSYTPGETINILVPTKDFTITNAHATLERASVLQAIDFDPETQTISFVAEPWMAPDITASLVLEGTKTDNTPVVYWGATHIEINDPSKELSLSVEAQQESYKPGDEVTLKISTQNQSKGVKSEVTIAVVDASLLALKSREPLDLKKTFFAEGFMPLGVQTIHTLANYVSEQKMEEIHEEIESVKAMADSRMGGGGGKSGEQKPRGEFRDTAHFEATVLTDQNGEATLTFTLPDNTTTWNVWAVAQTQNQQFAESESEFKATYPLVASPILPNVFQAGDELSIGVLVADNTQKEAETQLDVEIILPEEITTKTTTQRVSIDKTQRVLFPVTITQDIQDIRDIEITFHVKTPTHNDSIKLNRSIQPPKVNRFIADMLHIKSPQETKVISDKNALSSTITLRASSSLLQNANTLLKNLEARNYFSTEQNFSYWTSLLIENKIFQRDETALPYDQLTKSWEKIIEAQKPNGGFAFWPNGYSQANPWLTANILEFESLWEEKGFALSVDRKNQALKFLDTKSQEICVQGSPCIEDTTRLYANYILAKNNQIDGGRLEQMNKYTSTLESKIWWMMTYNELKKQNKLYGGKDLKKYAQEFRSTVQRQVRSRDRYLFLTQGDGRSQTFYHQDERLTALFLQLVMQEDSLISAPEKVAHYLTYSNTYNYSTNTSLRVMHALYLYGQQYEKETTNIPFVLTTQSPSNTNTQEGIIENRDTPYTTQIDAIPGEITNITAQKEDKNYYLAIELSESFKAQDTTAVSKGFWIEREYFELSDTKFETPITQFKAGTNYIARIKIISNTAHKQVKIADHIPTGADFVQFDLDSSDQTLEHLVQEQYHNPYLTRLSGCNGLCPVKPNHQEFDTNQARFFIEHLPAGPNEIKYIFTARLNGTYNVLPPHIEEMYNPEVFASGKGETITIKE